MQDQNSLPESNPSPKKPNLFRDWWDEMYPHDFIRTFKNYFFNHKQFFDEVFSEHWDNKVKPMAFLFTAIGVSLIIGSISPWGLKTDVSMEAVPGYQIIDSLSQKEKVEFNKVFWLPTFNEYKNEFDLTENNVRVNDSLYSLYVKNRLEVVTEYKPLTMSQLKEYLTDKNPALALK